MSPAAGRASATAGGINVLGDVIVGVSGLSDCCAARIGDRSAQSTPKRKSSLSVISATSTSISTWRGMRSSCLIVVSISAQLRGKVVTMIALVVSSAMKRTCPSTSPSLPTKPTPPIGPPGPVVGGGVGGMGGCPPGRGVVDGVDGVVGTVSRAP